MKISAFRKQCLQVLTIVDNTQQEPVEIISILVLDNWGPSSKRFSCFPALAVMKNALLQICKKKYFLNLKSSYYYF